MRMALIQIIAILGSVGLLLIVINLVRKRRLAEEYSLLWLLVGLGFVCISAFRGLIEEIAGLLGIVYAPSAIFLIAIFFIVWLLLHFSLIVSDLATRNRTLAQEIALLRLEMEKAATRRADDGAGTGAAPR
ncbi:MAG: DUF2304 domain-containing protein [bacterium]